jgi:hypothetical protein
MVLEPSYALASGTNGWHGSPDGSGSISLYGGTRRSSTGVVKRIEYQSLNPIAEQVGNPILQMPTTASIQFVYMTSDEIDLNYQVTATRWGAEHWGTVGRLYQDYYQIDPDYVTGSYDYYCLYFNQFSQNIVNFPSPYAAGLPLTGSFTVEGWVKPFITASNSQDFTIASMNRVFWFGITGSTGQLVMSSSYGALTSSYGPAARRWSHVACSFNATTGTGSFLINLNDAGQFKQTTFSASLGGFQPVFSLGAKASGSTEVASTSVGQLYRVFHGFMGEHRLWYQARTVAQLSASWNVQLTASSPVLTGSVIRTGFTEGPLATFPTDTNSNSPRNGSGTVDWASLEQLSANAAAGRLPWGYLVSFDDRIAPVWQPNDNVSFRPYKNLNGPPDSSPNLVQALSLTGSGLTGLGCAPVQRMLVIDVPQAFYGRQLQPNSVSVTDWTYSSSSYGLVRTLVDDGRGNLYLSGSACSSSLASKEDYAGVQWNKVGNVFYGEGLIVIKDQSLLDFGRLDGVSNDPSNVLQVGFMGQTRTPVKTLMCRLDHGEFNASNNPTFYTTGSAGERIARHPSGSVYVSTVGIYNSDRELVAVARLADPVRKRTRDRINIRLRVDF